MTNLRVSDFVIGLWVSVITRQTGMIYGCYSIWIRNYLCHSLNLTIKIDKWQLPHAYKVSTLQACKAFLATKIYPQNFDNKFKIPQTFFMNKSPII